MDWAQYPLHTRTTVFLHVPKMTNSIADSLAKGVSWIILWICFGVLRPLPFSAVLWLVPCFVFFILFQSSQSTVYINKIKSKKKIQGKTWGWDVNISNCKESIPIIIIIRRLWLWQDSAKNWVKGLLMKACLNVLFPLCNWKYVTFNINDLSLCWPRK